MRLIDADRARETATIDLVVHHLDRQPTIDAVEVVRCKDCNYYHDFETHYDCSNGYGIDYPRPDDYCSYGKKKGEGV